MQCVIFFLCCLVCKIVFVGVLFYRRISCFSSVNRTCSFNLILLYDSYDIVGYFVLSFNWVLKSIVLNGVWSSVFVLDLAEIEFWLMVCVVCWVIIIVGVMLGVNETKTKLNGVIWASVGDWPDSNSHQPVSGFPEFGGLTFEFDRMLFLMGIQIHSGTTWKSKNHNDTIHKIQYQEDTIDNFPIIFPSSVYSYVELNFLSFDT